MKNNTSILFYAITSYTLAVSIVAGETLATTHDETTAIVASTLALLFLLYPPSLGALIVESILLLASTARISVIPVPITPLETTPIILVSYPVIEAKTIIVPLSFIIMKSLIAHSIRVLSLHQQHSS